MGYSHQRFSPLTHINKQNVRRLVPAWSYSMADNRGQEAQALVKAGEASRLHAYIVLCLLTGCRTEEARALTWDYVDLDGNPDADPPVPPHIAVWRSVRSHGDVKTQKSRRTLRLPTESVNLSEALVAGVY